MTITPTSLRTVELPVDPKPSDELVAAARQPLARFDYAGTEHTDWREGSIVPFTGRWFSSQRSVAFSHEFQAIRHVEERTSEPQLEYAGPNFDGAVTIAKRMVNEANAGRSPRYAAALLQAADGAFFIAPMADVNGVFDRAGDPRSYEENRQLTPRVITIGARVTSPWTDPVAETPGTVATSRPDDAAAVKSSNVYSKPRVTDVVRRTPMLQAVVNYDNVLYDLRESTIEDA